MRNIGVNLRAVTRRVMIFSAGTVLVLMMIYGTVDALGPTVFARGVPGAYEWIGYSVVFVVWLALPLVHARKEGMISIPIVRDRMPVRIKRWFGIISSIIVTVLFVPLFWRSAIAAWDSWLAKDRLSTLPPFPIYPAKFAVAIGAGLVLAVCLLGLFSALTRFAHRARESRRI